MSSNKDKEIVKGVACVLKAEIPLWTKHVVCVKAFSMWTELRGKDVGCGYWSRSAYELYEAKQLVAEKVRHEHAVPKKVLWETLQQIPHTEEWVWDFFKYVIAVVVTKEEDELLNREFKDRMPEGFRTRHLPEYRDAFLRYRKCGIEVVKVCWRRYRDRRKLRTPVLAGGRRSPLCCSSRSNGCQTRRNAPCTTNGASEADRACPSLAERRGWSPVAGSRQEKGTKSKSNRSPGDEAQLPG
jgi:hypothetical protein